MTLGLADLGPQEGLDEVPGHGRSHGPSAHAGYVHVIVLDALPGREVVVDQASADTRNLVGADRCAHAAAAARHATIHFPCNHGLSERDDQVRIVIVRSQGMSAEFDDLMPRRAELADQPSFKPNPP